MNTVRLRNARRCSTAVGALLRACMYPILLLLVMALLGLVAVDVHAGAWSPVENLTPSRAYHTATLLNDGRVLVVGGRATGGAVLTSAAVYDPALATWTPTDSLTVARYYHTASLLADGRVLVAGGRGSNARGVLSAEIWDPTTGLWSATGDLNQARFSHAMVTLLNGQVLVTGGQDGSPGNPATVSAELYDPDTGIWNATGDLAVARYYHTATTLDDGRVLVAGGREIGVFNTAELYDPTTGLWSSAANLPARRYLHTATLLDDGTVLLAGGRNQSLVPMVTSYVYSPATNSWATVGAMSVARFAAAATLLNDGQVLVAGGNIDNANIATESDLYDPASQTWQPTGHMATARHYQTQTLLDDGRVLAVGGSTEDPGDEATASVEMFDASAPTPATLTIVKSVVGDVATTEWTFTGDLSPFTLPAAGGQQEFDNLTPGDFTVTETPDDQYTTTVACSSGESGANSVSVTLEEGEHVTCTFINTYVPTPATLTIVKSVVGDVATSDWSFTGDLSPFTLPAAGGQQVFDNLTPGDFTVTETPDDQYTTTVACSSGESGSNSVSVTLEEGEHVTCTFINTQIIVPAEDPIYLSLSGNATLSGLAVQPVDIVAWHPDTGEYTMVFDGSDVGITRNLIGFALLDDGSILFTMSGAQAVTDLGRVQATDIIRFVPGQLGDVTAGSFEWFLDGSDVGLNLNSKAIDAVLFNGSGDLLVSLTGNATVNGLAVRDEDILTFTAASFGSASEGSWTLAYDGSDLGIPDTVDVMDAYIDATTGNLYLSTDVNSVIAGLTVSRTDIVECAGPIPGENSACASLSLFWEGAAHGLTRSVDGFALGVSSGPINYPTGSIRIIKETASATSDRFNFTGDLGSFQLGNGESHLAPASHPGAYFVRESLTPGWHASAITCTTTDPADSTAVVPNGVVIDLDADEDITCTFHNEAGSTTSATVYAITSQRPGSVGGVDYSPSDIIAYDPAGDVWSMVFDGSAVGLTRNLNAFTFTDDGNLLLSFATRFYLSPDIGRVDPQDIVRFSPTVAGDFSAGIFSWLLDGSDVGLTTTNENIDAIDLTADGRLLVSIIGNGSVPGLKGIRDEDLIAFSPISTGLSSAGTWSMFFDGSTVAGMSAEDIGGVAVDRLTNDLLVTLYSSANLQGAVVNRQSVIRLTGPAGAYAALLEWDAQAAGFTGAIRGLALKK